VTRGQAGGDPGFCHRAWDATADLQDAIAQHPFNQALEQGTLEPERFAFYLVQDARYLGAFSEALAGASSQALEGDESRFFSESAARARAVEGTLHRRYLDRLLSPQAASGVPTAMACRRYTRFLRRAVDAGRYPVLVASLLPCFWIYHHVGSEIARRTGSRPDHPYREWIDTYADPAFADGVAEIRAIADRQAAQHPDQEDAMINAFRKGSRHEWAFWDAAWHLAEAGGEPSAQ